MLRITLNKLVVPYNNRRTDYILVVFHGQGIYSLNNPGDEVFKFNKNPRWREQSLLLLSVFCQRDLHLSLLGYLNTVKRISGSRF